MYKDSYQFPFLSFDCNLFLLLVNGEKDVVVEDVEDEEELYELASMPNGETSDVSSEAEGSPDEERSEMSDSDEMDAASCQSTTTLGLQKAIIEDIRFVLILSPLQFPTQCPPKYHDFVLPNRAP